MKGIEGRVFTNSSHAQTTRSHRRWVVLALSALLLTCSQFYRVSNAVIAPQLSNELHLTPDQLGLLGAAFFYAFALVQLPLGILLDRIGARLTMAAFSLIGAFGSMMFAMSQGMTTAILGRILLGVGMSCNLMGPMKLLTSWFSPREFATLSGVLMGLGTLGNMFAATPLVMLVGVFGWRSSFLMIGGLTVALAVLFYAIVRDAPAEGNETPRSPSNNPERLTLSAMVRTLLSCREYWLISFSTFFRYGTFVGIQGLWAGPFLMEIVHLSPMATGNLLLMMTLGNIFGAPLGGWLSDRVLSNRKWVIIMGLAGLSIGEGLLVLRWEIHDAWLLGAVFLLLGVSNAFGPIMYAHIKEIMPSEMTGMAFTWINLFTMLGGAFFLHGMGIILDWSLAAGRSGPEAYGTAFLTGSVGMMIAVLLYLFTREKPLKL